MKPLPYERYPVSNLKVLNAEKLRALGHALVIERHSEPLAVLVPYEWYSAALDLIQGRDGR